MEHGLWQDVDIYFNGKKYTSYDPENGEYYYNDREHLIEVADQPERHFEYVNPEHILSMSFEDRYVRCCTTVSFLRSEENLTRYLRDTVCIMSSGIIGIFSCYYI